MTTDRDVSSTPDDASDPEALTTELERRLRADPAPSPVETAHLREELANLYLYRLDDPLGAAVHVEELLGGDVIGEGVFTTARELAQRKPTAARIANQLSLTFQRLGRKDDETASLVHELEIAKPARRKAARDRLVELSKAASDAEAGPRVNVPRPAAGAASPKRRRTKSLPDTDVKAVVLEKPREPDEPRFTSERPPPRPLHGELPLPSAPAPEAIAAPPAPEVVAAPTMPSPEAVPAPVVDPPQATSAAEGGSSGGGTAGERPQGGSRPPETQGTAGGSPQGGSRPPETYAELAAALELVRSGDTDAALRAFDALLEKPALADAVLEEIAEAAEDLEVPSLLMNALEQLARSADLAVRATALEKLGDLHEKRGNRRAALESWRPAARLSAEEGGDNRARELFERVLAASPGDGEAAERLVGLYTREGDWNSVPGAYSALLNAGGSPELAALRLLELEAPAAQSGAVSEFVTMADEVLGRLGAEPAPEKPSLLRARARVLATDGSRQREATEAFRALLESSGAEGVATDYRTFAEAKASADDRQEDLRWLFEWRVLRAKAPAAVLAEWARAEEDYGDPAAAAKIYERLLAAAPERIDALEALARLSARALDLGEGDGAPAEVRRARFVVELSQRYARDPERAFAVLEQALAELPREATLWDAVEDLARKKKEPDRFAQAFRAALRAGRLPREDVEALGRRVVALEDDSGADVTSVMTTLEAVLDAAPGTRWAFDRVKLAFSSAGRFEDLFRLYDGAILDAASDSARAELLAEAVLAARDMAGDVDRAVSYLEALSPLRPADAKVVAGLERLYERQGSTTKLIELEAARARDATGPLKVELERKVASLELDIGDLVAAHAVLEGLAGDGGGLGNAQDLFERLLRIRAAGAAIDGPAPDEEAKICEGALGRLREYRGRSGDLLPVVRLELLLVRGPERRAHLAEELVQLHLTARKDAPAPLHAALLEIAADTSTDAELARVAAEELRRRVTEAWEKAPSESGDAAEVAYFVVHSCAALRLDGGDVEGAAALLLESSRLPFGAARRRAIAADAAFLLCDRLGASDRAVVVLRELFDEDLADAVAERATDRYAELLVHEHRLDECAELWERLARHRGAEGDLATARERLERAARLREDAGDAERAIADYRESASLGSTSALSELVRLHGARDEWEDAAAALEWLFADTEGEEGADVALELAEIYADHGQSEFARGRLEDAVERGPNAALAAGPRLAELYRAEALWEDLAGLLTYLCDLVADGAVRLTLLEEAAEVLAVRRGEPLRAIPLYEAALGLRPDSTTLQVALGDALAAVERLDDAIELYRRRLAEFGERRPKQRAPIHRRLATCLARLGRRAEALEELKLAVAIDPTAEDILWDLGQAARAEGQLEVADRALRALLLAQHPSPGAPSGVPPRVDVYLELSELAAALGDRPRADDLLESAFAAALEGPEEAKSLERALAARGHYEPLARAIERRLLDAEDLERAGAALADLSEVLAAPRFEGSELARNLGRHVDRLADMARKSATTDAALWAAFGRAAQISGGDEARANVLRRRASLLVQVASEDGTGSREALHEAATLFAGELGEPETALGIYEVLFEKDPSDAESWQRLSALSFSLGRSEGLCALLEKAIPRVGSSELEAELRFEYGRLLLQMPGRSGEGVEHLSRLVAEDPGEVRALSLLTEVLEREGRDDELAHVLRARLSALGDSGGPEAGRLGLRLASVLERTSRADEARGVYESLAAAPELDRATLRALSLRLSALGSPRYADCLERLIPEEAPAEARVLSARLVALADELGDEGRVKRALLAAFERDPSNAAFRERLVAVHHAAGEPMDAARVLETAYRAAPDDPALALGAAAEYRAAGEPGLALPGLDDAVARHPAHAALQAARSSVHEALGHATEAVRDLEAAVAADAARSPDLAALLERLVELPGSDGWDEHVIRLVDLSRAREGGEPSARRYLERLLEAQPQHPAALERLASFLSTDDAEAALEVFERLLPAVGSDEEAFARIAVAYADAAVRAGRAAAARPAIERAYAAKATPEVIARVVAVYRAVGEYGRAADLIEDEAKALSGARRAALFCQAAELWGRMGTGRPRVLAALDAAREADPENADVVLAVAHAWAEEGRAAEALAVLGGWLEHSRGKPIAVAARVHLEVGKLHLAADELAEAFESLKRSFGLDPKNDETDLLLGQLAIDLDDEQVATRALRALTALRSEKVPRESRGAAFYLLARLAERRGDRKSARLMAVHAVNENPEHGQAKQLLEDLGR